MSVTSHFIRITECDTGSHNAENILANHQDIIAKFNLENKVGTIITDNALNMIKAFVTLPGLDQRYS